VRVREIGLADDLHPAAFDQVLQLLQFARPLVVVGTNGKTIEPIGVQVPVDYRGERILGSV
jgi:hypothetical protein